MTNGLFLSENQRKKWVQPSRCAPKWSKFSNHLVADRNFLYWAFLADRFSFFRIIFVIFFILSPRSQWTESKSKQQGRSPDKRKMTPGAAPNLDRIKVWSPAWEEINDYLFIESSLHWPKLKTFMRSSWNVNCESWLKIDTVFRRQ